MQLLQARQKTLEAPPVEGYLADNLIESRALGKCTTTMFICGYEYVLHNIMVNVLLIKE